MTLKKRKMLSIRRNAANAENGEHSDENHIRKHYDKNALSEFYYICILKTNFQNLDYTGNQNINLLKYARNCETDLF